ncbi:hypothetical protein INR49_001341 [Caranx melampygus]|nr:hypothetical protein INR49_001341 [Caranx melampygus]
MDNGFDLSDALGPSPTEAPKPPPKAPEKPKIHDGELDLLDAFGDGGFDLNLEDALGPGGGELGGADQPQEAGSGQIAGIVSAIGVALLGAASSYFAYQKKKLCFKLQGGQDPEMGKGQQGTHSQQPAQDTIEAQDERRLYNNTRNFSQLPVISGPDQDFLCRPIIKQLKHNLYVVSFLSFYFSVQF